MRKIIWVLFFVIGIFIPSITYIYNNSYKIIGTKEYNLGITDEITKDIKYSQDINIPENIKKIGIMFGTYLRNNKGLLKVSIEQEKVKIETNIDVSKIENNKINYVKMNFSKLKKGKATLTIKGIDGKKGNSVCIFKSSDISLGKINRSQEASGIMYEMTYYSFNNIVKLQLLYLMLTTIMYIVIYKLSKNEKKNNKKLYVFVSLMIFFMINVKVPIVSFHAEPYVETLTNFLIYGIQKNFIQNLLIPDVGYLPLFTRIIGLFIIKIFGFNLKWTVFLMQNIGILLITFSASLFITNKFKKYGNFLFRMCVSIILGGGVTLTSSVEGYYFFNFVYYGFVTLVFFSLINFSRLKKINYLMILLLTFLIITSKSHYIILFPIAFLILVLLRKKINKREKIYLVIMIISSFFQLLFIKMNNSGGLVNQELRYPTISEILYRVVQQFIFVFFPVITDMYNIGFLNIAFLIGWFFLLGINFFFLIKLKNKESVISVTLLFLIVGVVILNISTTGNMFGWNQPYSWLNTSIILNARHSLFIIISYICLIILMLYNMKKILYRYLNTHSIFKFKNLKICEKIVYIIISFILIIRFSAFDNNEAKNQYPNSIKVERAISDWKIYYKFFKTENYLIPEEPFLLLSKNNNVYLISNNVIKKENSLQGRDKSIDLYWIEGYINKETLQIHEVDLKKEIGINFLYTERLRANNFDSLKIIGLNEKNEVVWEIKQLNNSEKQFVGFKIDNLKKVRRIKFYTLDNNIAFVKDNIFIGTSDEYY